MQNEYIYIYYTTKASPISNICRCIVNIASLYRFYYIYLSYTKVFNSHIGIDIRENILLTLINFIKAVGTIKYYDLCKNLK